MLYFPNESMDAAYNQAFEECAFERCTEGDVLLIWRNRPAVVCGRYQNLFQEVHLPTAQERGVQWVRRITGGGCVYHDPGNVNYALITDYRDGMGYEALLNRVVDVLSSLGIPARRGGSSSLTLGGEKISGSAQRVSKGRLLHHGTLLFDADLFALKGLANGHSTFYQSKAIRSVPAPVVNIRQYVKDMTVEEFAQRLAEAFAPDCVREADFVPEARQLAEEKYRSWEWTCANSPKFTFERTEDGAPWKIAYRAEKAVIREISVEGDCGEALCRALEGARLDLDELRVRVGDVLKDRQRTEQWMHCMF